MVSKAERAASAASRTAGRGVGAGIGAAFSSPAGFATIAAVSIIILLVIFRDRIGGFFENALKIPPINIEIPNPFEGFEFPNPFEGFEFPNPFEGFEFPNPFEGFDPRFFEEFLDFFKGDTDDPADQPPPPAGTIDDPALGEIETPEGCIRNPDGTIFCPSPPTFDVCNEFPELCEPCAAGETRIGGICRPAQLPSDMPPEQPDPEQEPFMPPVELPEDFTFTQPDPEGQFGGGTIFETDICNKSIGQIAQENGISASAAADMKFQACETSDFDFGTNTGSGFGAGDDPLTDPLVTGGATLESEEKRAACTSCELFGLNCPLCAGTI